MLKKYSEGINLSWTVEYRVLLGLKKLRTLVLTEEVVVKLSTACSIKLLKR